MMKSASQVADAIVCWNAKDPKLARALRKLVTVHAVDEEFLSQEV